MIIRRHILHLSGLRCEIETRIGDRFLSLGFDREHNPAIWVVSDENAKIVRSGLICLSTEQRIQGVGFFLGTINDGAGVWHIFTDRNPTIRMFSTDVGFWHYD